MEKKPKKEAPGAPGWIVTFADLMSLLLTFFVLLLSFAETDVKKFKEAVGSLKDAFGVQSTHLLAGSPSSNNPLEQNYSQGAKEWEDFNFSQRQVGINIQDVCAFEKRQMKMDEKELKERIQDISKQMTEKGLRQPASLAVEKGKMRFQFKFSDFFLPGESKWAQGATSQFKSLLNLIDQQNARLKVVLTSYAPSRINQSNVRDWSLQSRRVLNLSLRLKKEAYRNIAQVSSRSEDSADGAGKEAYFFIDVGLLPGE